MDSYSRSREVEKPNPAKAARQATVERAVKTPAVEGLSYLHCMSCGKQVSTAFLPVPTDTPDRGLIVRAFIECPECIEAKR